MDYSGCFENDRVEFTQRTSTRGIVYSEHFLVWDTYSFRPHPSGGVELSRWTEVEWITDLPWTHKFIKYTVEKKTMDAARASTKTLVQILQEVTQQNLRGS